MKLVLTAKVKLLPTDEQKQLLIETMTQTKKALNYVSDVCFEKGIITNSKKLQKLTYDTVRADLGLKSQMACNVCNTVSGNYATEVTNKTFNRVVYKKPKLVYSYNRDFTFTKDNLISIGTLKNRVKMPYACQGVDHFFQDGWEFATSELKYKKGKFFLHINVKKEVEDIQSPYQNVVGVDLGMRFLITAVDSHDKHLFVSGKQVKQIRTKRLKQRQQLQALGTKNAKRKLKRLAGKENRYMSDVNHQISKALIQQVGQNSLIAIEDLTDINIKTYVWHDFRYHRLSWAFYQLRQMIEYKAKLNHSTVIDCDPAYTSQKCPKCGYIHKANRNKKTHTFTCQSCGYQSNDDRIGALNLKQLGIEYHSQENKNLLEQVLQEEGA